MTPACSTVTGMNSPNTLTPSATRSCNLEDARSALAFYLDRSISTNDNAPLRRREELIEARRALDAHGPLCVPAVVVTDAVEHWEARFAEAEARLLSGASQDVSPCFVEKLNSLIALKDLRALARARGREVETPVSRRPCGIGATLRRFFGL